MPAKTHKTDYPALIRAFGKASTLSITFVLFPVILLLLGVWLDKKLATTPLFIIIGILAGIVVFIYQVRKAVKDIQEK
jgi:F0F1-type ATP synthase assembly protein I